MLLLDEVLAVGDLGFKQKCFAKLDELKESGSSIILVTHAVDRLKNFADQCLYLKEGECRAWDESIPVLKQYRLDLLEEDALRKKKLLKV